MSLETLGEGLRFSLTAQVMVFGVLALLGLMIEAIRLIFYRPEGSAYRPEGSAYRPEGSAAEAAAPQTAPPTGVPQTVSGSAAAAAVAAVAEHRKSAAPSNSAAQVAAAIAAVLHHHAALGRPAAGRRSAQPVRMGTDGSDGSAGPWRLRARQAGVDNKSKSRRRWMNG